MSKIYCKHERARNIDVRLPGFSGERIRVLDCPDCKKYTLVIDARNDRMFDVVDINGHVFTKEQEE